MKNLLLFITVFIFFSCAKDDYNGNDSTTPIDLRFAAEQQTIPAEKGADLYAVQVYITVAGSDDYVAYAYGLFDNNSDIKLVLPDDARYKIESTIVIDGKQLVSHDSLSYYEPFVANDHTPVELSNKFTISSTRYFTDLSGSKSRVVSQTKDSTYNHIYLIPALDRYYGELADFDPELSPKAEVNMDRVVFGMNLSIKNTTKSTISLKIDGTPDSLVVEGGSNRALDRLYTLPDFKKAGELLDPLKITIQHNNGGVLVEGQGEYFVKKQAREIITLTVSKADKTKASYNYDIESIAGFY